MAVWEQNGFVSILVVHPHDFVADWGLWVAAAAQHTRVQYCILLAKEKI